MAEVELDGCCLAAHVPSSGRLTELLVPGRTVALLRHPGGERRTRFSLELVRIRRGWTAIGGVLANRLAVEGVWEGRFADVWGTGPIRKEVPWEKGRVDLWLDGPTGSRLIEVKAVTLVEGGIALFPDAPTARGTRQLRALTRARQVGLDAAVLFVILRGDAREIQPHVCHDPAFTRALREASTAGVWVGAVDCAVGVREVVLRRWVPICGLHCDSASGDG